MNHRIFLLACAVLCSLGSTTAATAADAVRVVVWDEQQPSQKQAYPSFLGEYITDYLKRQPGLEVNSVSIDHPEKGLSDAVLDNCDVLIWWGHVRNRDISVVEADRVVRRLRQGKVQLIALHSAHWATPFVLAMHQRAEADAMKTLSPEDRKKAKVQFVGEIVRRAPKRDAELTPRAVFDKQDDGSISISITRPNCCFPAYRNDGKPSEIRTLLPDHPIAKGIPHKFTLPHTEMYDEPFHVPEPDDVVFEENWESGERFRSGSVWKIGKGKLFYFRPGHETHAVYTQPLPMKIIENAVRWLGAESPEPK